MKTKLISCTNLCPLMTRKCPIKPNPHARKSSRFAKKNMLKVIFNRIIYLAESTKNN